MVVAMVPMRSGSKSIPDKNIKDFLGFPLFDRNVCTLLKCMDCGIVDKIYINTDSLYYRGVVEKIIGDPRIQFFTRSDRTARDDAVNIDVAQEFIEKVDLEDDDILLYVQVTAPYLMVEDVEAVLKKMGAPVFLYDRWYDTEKSAMTVFNDTKGFIIDGDMPEEGARNTPRQKLSRFRTNGCIYACTTAGSIRRTASLWEPPIYYHVQPHGFELDEPADWVYAEEVMREKCE